MTAAATTYYDVVTRYRTEDLSHRQLDGYTRRVGRADRASVGLNSRIYATSRGLRFVARAAGPALAGMTALGAAGYGVTRTFRNLNEAMTSSITMASQINISAAFSPDPIQNFNASLMASKGLIRDITKDAAALPGEARDFMAIANLITGPVLQAGGSLRQVRELSARAGIFGAAQKQSGTDTARQTMALLLGQAGIDRPLFAALQPILGINAQQFNALPAAERMDRLDASLRRFTDNPVFRKEIIGTLDTQLGTLADNLFGLEGIGGQVLTGPFENLTAGLADLNTKIEAHTPAIVDGLLRVGDAIAVAGEGVRRSPLLIGGSYLFDSLSNRLSGRRLAALGAAVTDPLVTLNPVNLLGAYVRAQKAVDERALLRPDPANLYEQLMGIKPPGDFTEAFDRKDVPQAQIEQNFTVKIDLKSDTSPDAVALRMVKALEKVGKHPTTTGLLKTTPGNSAMKP